MPSILPDTPIPTPFTQDDRIFLGEGLFETLRVFAGKPCYPDLHWQRLRQSAALLQIPLQLPYASWLQQLEHCVQESPKPVNGIKVVLSGGRAARGLLTAGTKPQLIWTGFHYSRLTTPLILQSSSWRRDSQNPIYGVKSINYLEAIMARRQAVAQGADDVLFFNTEGHATETTIANLFMVVNNCLYTPPLHCGVLAGILRQRLITQASAWGIACYEMPLTRTQLDEADALWICNALQGVRAVQRLDKTEYETHHPLLALLRERLEADAHR